jgi:hypothetical protein
LPKLGDGATLYASRATWKTTLVTTYGPMEKSPMSKQGWIAVDLDGTLAHYDGFKGPEHIGDPVPKMLARVKAWIDDGRDVRIFTARVDGGTVALNMGNPDGEAFKEIEKVRGFIESWCAKHIGKVLPVTSQKDYGMVELWDDRCVQIIPNTGERADGLE